MAYVDGFILAVPEANREKFREHAALFAEIFRTEYGALRVVDCWGDEVPEGEVTSFPLAVRGRDDEIVVFSWIEWPDKPTRDAAMAKMRADTRFSPETNPMPFDGKRMIFGGFTPIIDT